jgi:hypothetical protein
LEAAALAAANAKPGKTPAPVAKQQPVSAARPDSSKD